MSPWQPIRLFKNSYRKSSLQRAQETAVAFLFLAWGLFSFWHHSRQLSAFFSHSVVLRFSFILQPRAGIMWAECTINIMITILFLYHMLTCMCLLFVLDCESVILFGIFLYEISLCLFFFSAYCFRLLYCSSMFYFEALILL